MRLLVLDPGTLYTGYAYWSGSDNFLKRYGLIKAPQKLPPNARIRIIGAGFQRIVMEFKPALLVYEYLEMQKRAAGVAAVRKGHLLQVAKLIGYLGCLWDSYARWQISRKSLLPLEEPYEITPTQWKGNLPKHIVRSSVNMTFNLNLKSGTGEHIADALGLGAWFMKQKGESHSFGGDLDQLRIDVSAEEPPPVKIITA